MNRCPALRGQSDQRFRRQLQPEVFVPLVGARIEQAHKLAAIGVQPFNTIGFEQIAATTGEREVRQLIGTAGKRGDDVLDLEWEIEDGFRRLAVFAPMGSPCRHLGITRIHAPRIPAISLARRPAALISSSTNASNSAAISGESSPPASRTSRQRLTNSPSRCCCVAEK